MLKKHEFCIKDAYIAHCKNIFLICDCVYLESQTYLKMRITHYILLFTISQIPHGQSYDHFVENQHLKKMMWRLNASPPALFSWPVATFAEIFIFSQSLSISCPPLQQRKILLEWNYSKAESIRAGALVTAINIPCQTCTWMKTFPVY